MIYVINVPDDLTGYETDPGDFESALMSTIETWLGPDYEAVKATELPEFEGEPVRWQP